LSFDAI
jgi:sphingomyelin phosphodiesterase